MKRFNNIKKQAGFNLIEVLLAFLILSIGLLGVAGLQTTAVKASHSAMLKTIAISKVQEIVERIRSNTSATMKMYELPLDGLGTDFNCDDRGTPVGVSCSPEDLAKNDLYVWRKSLTNGALPADGVNASIELDDTETPPVAIITVLWRERGDDLTYSVKIQQLPPISSI